MSTVLIVIDVQESFRRQPRWSDVSNPSIAASVHRLVDSARAAGHEVVWVLHAEPGSGSAARPPRVSPPTSATA